MTRSLTAFAVLAALLAVLAPGAAGAAYDPGAELVSVDPAGMEQADDDVQSTVISQDGRYVVFQSTARNLYPASDPGDPPNQIRRGGIFRRDLLTGALDLVAYGDLRDLNPAKLVARGAQNPSVSADGRWVSFSTGWALVPADTNANIDVYVRDMTKPLDAPDAFELVSARDGRDAPAAYAATGPARGVETTTGASISADGTMVLFRTTVNSDLPAAASVTVPLGQLLLRDRTSKSTTLVTRTLQDGSPAGGATGPFAISADGTTVVWTGSNAAAQTLFLPAELQDPSLFYYLWRRVADGPSVPTRRVTGAVDLDDPACTPELQQAYADNPELTGPCYGPLILREDEFTQGFAAGKPAAISGDGHLVAFLTGIVPRGTIAGAQTVDLWLTDMTAGVSRKQGTVQLTTRNSACATCSDTNAAVLSAAMSADGRRLALTTARTTFLLPRPRLTGPPLPAPDRIELYVIDLDLGEIILASTGLDGGGANGDIGGLLSLSGDGKRIAFTTGATNLFRGDANEKADAFVLTDGGDAQRQLEQGEPVFSDYGSRPSGGRSTVTKLAVRSSRGHGSVRLRVRVPGPGRVRATARARGKTVAITSATPGSAGTTVLVLRPKSHFRKLLRRHGRLGASVTVQFAPRIAGPSLSTKRHVTFRR